MKHSNFRKVMYFAIAVSMVACQTIDDPILDPNQIGTVIESDNEFITTEGQTVLGDAIDIPYSIENLLKAYENLPAQTKSEIDPKDIQPTHYYVRFYPKSIEEQDILRNIKPYVFLSETPLDRKVVVGGSSYHDPSIPEDLPTFQYTVVPVERWRELEKTVPVEAEILIKAYIPDYDEAYTTKSEEQYGIPAHAYDALLKEAYRITGNEYFPETKASWTPSGRIRAYDNVHNAMTPVPGVRVRATHLLKVKEGLTDNEGRFTLASFNSSVTYKIIWESNDWDIRDGLTGQATFDGPTLSTSWFPEIGTTHEKNVRYAATQRAAYTFYFKDIEGILRPAFNNKLKICQHDTSNSYPSVFTNANAMGYHIESWIYDIFGSLHSIDKMYYVIAHELGHSAHYSHNDNDYGSYSTAVKESWALFSGLIAYNKEYGSQNTDGFIYYNVYEKEWPGTSSGNSIEYTPIFLDLYDDYNQHLDNTIPNCSSLPDDSVSGYTGLQLSGILSNNTYTKKKKKTKVKWSEPVGVTDSDIDTLFELYVTNSVDDFINPN